jgi:hypothetical protein
MTNETENKEVKIVKKKEWNERREKQRREQKGTEDKAKKELMTNKT